MWWKPHNFSSFEAAAFHIHCSLLNSLLQWETEIWLPHAGYHSMICSFYLNCCLPSTAIFLQQPIVCSSNSQFKIFLRLRRILLPVSRNHQLVFSTNLCQLRLVALGRTAVPLPVINRTLLHKQHCSHKGLCSAEEAWASCSKIYCLDIKLCCVIRIFLIWMIKICYFLPFAVHELYKCKPVHTC